MLSKQNYVVVSIVLLAVLLGMTLSQGLQWIWVTLSWDDPFIGGVREVPMTAAIAYGIAFIGAVFTLKHKPTYELSLEIVDELSKVTWPSREETGNATVVVIVTVIICSVYLGAFDAVWLWLTDLLLGVPPGSEAG